MPIQLTRDRLVTLDDQEGAVGVYDDDMIRGQGPFVAAPAEIEVPAGAVANDGGEEGEEERSQKGEAVGASDGEDEEGDGH